jgi:hypothetical protein
MDYSLLTLALQVMDFIDPADLMKMDVFTMMNTGKEYTDAMLALAQDGNLLAAGSKIAAFILRTEFSVAEGIWQLQDPRTGAFEAGDPAGLGFTMWTEALPASARALRARKRAGDEDMADILECKYVPHFLEPAFLVA